ncbi:hypothetical protein DFH27DRAFT_612467 [Peziza echinospora]|nr:hypothetical protein DFH27DRAFT_612467 [Peziza echinospora]
MPSSAPGRSRHGEPSDPALGGERARYTCNRGTLPHYVAQSTYYKHQQASSAFAISSEGNGIRFELPPLDPVEDEDSPAVDPSTYNILRLQSNPLYGPGMQCAPPGANRGGNRVDQVPSMPQPRIEGPSRGIDRPQTPRGQSSDDRRHNPGWFPSGQTTRVGNMDTYRQGGVGGASNGGAWLSRVDDARDPRHILDVVQEDEVPVDSQQEQLQREGHDEVDEDFNLYAHGNHRHQPSLSSPTWSVQDLNMERVRDDSQEHDIEERTDIEQERQEEDREMRQSENPMLELEDGGDEPKFSREIQPSNQHERPPTPTSPRIPSPSVEDHEEERPESPQNPEPEDNVRPQEEEEEQIEQAEQYVGEFFEGFNIHDLLDAPGLPVDSHLGLAMYLL